MTGAIRTSAGRWRPALMVLLVLLVGCETELRPFQLSLEFNSMRGGPRACSQCQDFALECPGLVGIRLSNPFDTKEQLGYRCSRTPSAAMTVCDISQLTTEFDEVRPGKVRVEIALWRADTLDDGQCVTAPLLDLQGEPLPSLRPQPAFTGEASFEAGVDEVVDIPMSCILPTLMTAEMCPDAEGAGAGGVHPR